MVAALPTPEGRCGMSGTPVLRVVGLAAFTSMVSVRVCDPMLVTLADEFGVRTGDAAAVIAAFAIAYGLMQLVYGPIGDRVGKLRVIFAAALACSLACVLTALAPTLPLLVAARVFMGAAAAGIIPLTMAWIGDQVPYDQRQETLARLLLATVSGIMAGQWLGGIAAETLGWRSAFGLLAVLFFTSAWLLRDAVRAQVSGGATVSMGQSLRASGRVLRLPRVRWVLGVTVLEGAMAFGTLSFAPARLAEAYGLSAATSGAVMVLYGVGGLVYAWFARRWLRLLGERGLARCGGVLIAFGLLSLAWPLHVLLSALGCLSAGLGFYMLHNTLQTQATQMAPESRGTAVTLFACMLFMGQSLGVLLIGRTVDGGWLPVTFSAAALCVVALGWKVSGRVRARGAA
jgi:predicted MFS family arabinose efflux permease